MSKRAPSGEQDSTVTGSGRRGSHKSVKSRPEASAHPVAGYERQSSVPGYRTTSYSEDSSTAPIDEDFVAHAQRRGSRRTTLKVQHSVDSVESGASGGSSSASEPPAAAASAASSNKFKTIWNRAVTSLIGKKEKSKEKTPPVTDVQPASAPGDSPEVDPVYSFLKLTADIPRQGSNIIPGDGHVCCAASRAANMEQDPETVAKLLQIEKSRCSCPCHLPEKLQAYHNAWRETFVHRKT